MIIFEMRTNSDTLATVRYNENTKGVSVKQGSIWMPVQNIIEDGIFTKLSLSVSKDRDYNITVLTNDFESIKDKMEESNEVRGRD